MNIWQKIWDKDNRWALFVIPFIIFNLFVPLFSEDLRVLFLAIAIGIMLFLAEFNLKYIFFILPIAISTWVLMGVNFFDATIVGSIFGAMIVFSFFFIFLSIFRYNGKLKNENKKSYKFFKYLVVFPAVVLLLLLYFGIKEGFLIDILQSTANKIEENRQITDTAKIP